MAAPQFERTFIQDLTQDVRIRHCGNLLFEGDANSNIITVELFNGQDPAAISGTVAGYAIRNDFTTVPLTGSISGNKVMVTLSASCFTQMGTLSVGVQVISGTGSSAIKTTVFKGVYTIDQIFTDDVIDPAGTITLSVSDLIAQIAAAVATIPPEYTDLLAAIAPSYADLTFPIVAGQLCWYGGEMYAAKQAIPVTETWTAAHWQATNVSDAIKAEGSRISAMIAPTEASTTASMAHLAGSYFILSGVLYEATEDIASSASIITSGTGANCQAVPDGLGGEISDLKSDMNAALAGIHGTLSDTMPVFGRANGFLAESGSIVASGASTAADNIQKYQIPAGTTKLYITGAMNFNVTSPRYCAIWFVANGAMMEGGFVPQATKPQTWDMFEVAVPSGAEEIWADKHISVSLSGTIAANIENRLTTEEANSAKQAATIKEIGGTLTESLRTPYAYADGFLGQNGTIKSASIPSAANNIKKYTIPAGMEAVYLSGTLNLNLTLQLCAIWFVANGAMMEGGYVPQATKPQTWDMFEVAVPSGAEEIWADQRMTVYTSAQITPNVANRLAALEGSSAGTASQITALDGRVDALEEESAGAASQITALDERMDAMEGLATDVSGLKTSMTPILTKYGDGPKGWLGESGNIKGRGATTAPGNIYKYNIPDGTSNIYISGTMNFATTAPRYCAIWFVANGAMMEGGYVPQATKPQTWDMFEVAVPSGAEEIWADKHISVYPTNTYIPDVATKIYQIEDNEAGAGFFGGAFPWTKRVLGMRMLADAQGCYFIPFNAVGIGVNRGNGMHGDDYIADQIHPTALGGYNVACGVWSYLKNIPVWHTSIPASGTPEPLDGTQWNGKKWYAYGTSLTTQSYGKYANQVAAWSGLTLSNKAIGGGALVTNRNIYNALLDMEDGKLEADLITIEVGANDGGDLGLPWSMDNNTFFGALNYCIKSMLDNGVQAQIVIMASYPARYSASDPTIKYGVDRLYNNA